MTRLGDFCCLDDFLKPVVTTILVEIAHIFGLFLKKCHFSYESIFVQLFIDVGRLLTQAFGSPWQ